MTTEQTDDAPEETLPALFMHCKTVFEAMQEAGEPYAEDPDYWIYRGFLTHLFRDNNLSVPYYTKVMALLKEMDCVRQLSRGGGPAPSEWLLLQEPSLEMFELARQKLEMGGTLRQTKTSMLEQQVRDINTRLTSLEDLVQELATNA